MLFFNKKNKAEQEELLKKQEEENLRKSKEAQKEAHKDVPIPGIIPMVHNRLNGEEVLSAPEDTVSPERKEELIELLYEPKLDADQVHGFETQEILFLMLAMELYHKAAPLENFETNHRTLYNEILDRVRDAQELYMLFDKRTGYPFIYSGCACIYLDQKSAEEAAAELKKILREIFVAKVQGEIGGETDKSIFEYLNFTGISMLLIDNGKYRCRFHRDEIRLSLDWNENAADKPPVNPELFYAMTDFLQEAKWPVNYEKKKEVLTLKQAIMADRLRKATLIVPVLEQPDGRKALMAMPDRNQEKMLAVFTDASEYSKVKTPGMEFKGQRMDWKTICRAVGELKGIILNPMGHRIAITTEQARQILAGAAPKASVPSGESAGNQPETAPMEEKSADVEAVKAAADADTGNVTDAAEHVNDTAAGSGQPSEKTE